MASPNFPKALESFASLLGLIENGTLDLTWFGDPSSKTVAAMPANREEIGNTFSYLTQGTAGSDQPFPVGLAWQPDTSSPIHFGFVWNPVPPPADPAKAPLQIGMGATAAVPPQTISALAQLFDVNNGTVKSDMGRITVQLPVPSFLSSVSVTADAVTPGIQITVADGSATPRTLKFDLTSTQSAAWDGVRLGLFILQSWLEKLPQGSLTTDLTPRLVQFLFPMLGDATGTPSIPASALIGQSNMGLPPDFSAWAKAIFSLDPTNQNALTFLCQIRGLLTGEQTSTLIGAAGHSLFVSLTNSPQTDKAGIPALSGTWPPAAPSPGAWIGLKSDGSGGVNLVLALYVSGPAPPAEIALANLSASDKITLPSNASNWAAITACLGQLGANGLQINPSYKITASQPTPPPQPTASSPWTIALLDQQIGGAGQAVSNFYGNYGLRLTVGPSGAISFAPSMPSFPLTMPPTAKDVVATILKWVINAVPPSGNPFETIAVALAQFAEDALTAPPADPKDLLIALATVAVAALKGDTGPLALKMLQVGAKKDAVLQAGLTLGPFDPGGLDDSFPVHIGQIGANVQINLSEAPRLHGFGFLFNDLRLGDQSGGGTSLIGSLLPNLNKIKGFSLDVEWTTPGTVQVSGSATIPIQQTLGPLTIGSLSVDVRNKSVQVGLDLTFQLGPINVSTQDLGLQIGFDGSGSLPFLQGLGLSMNTSLINLSGLFGKVGTDYIGGAVVDVVNMFQVSAIGAYTKVPVDKNPANDKPSLFIFASLVAPLGGTPWMFITGVAGGFGLNRKLPPAMPLSQNPFLRVMSGDLQLGSGGAAAELKTLAAEFKAVAGEFWVAGGIQFISFGLIHGKIIVAVAFGHDFSLQILGSASCGIADIAYFEIDIEVTADAEKFILIASVSPSSYILDPKIFSLEGDFGLGVWHGGPHAGDFLISIGGYHPYYNVPSYYPALNRVGVKATISLGITINIAIECFFACTPHALMAGASCSISASIIGISCGLDVYVDVLIQWDPFFIEADLGVVVWFVFFGRHEIGVELQIHTPPFGGVATVHLLIVSFSFSFGSDILQPPAPRVFQFVGKTLQASATENAKGVAEVVAFNTGKKTGLLKLAVTWGRAGTLQDKSSTPQEGTDYKHPILVNAEFVVQISTRLPFAYESKTTATGEIALLGLTSLALCHKTAKHSTLTIKGSGVDLAIDEKLPDKFPQAEFGDSIAAIQGDGARQNVAKLDTKTPSVSLTNIAILAYYATQAPAAKVIPTYKGRDEQESEGMERFPLPLASSSVPAPVRVKPSKFRFSSGALTVSLKPYVAPISSSEAAGLEISQAVKTPLRVTQLSAQWLRESALGPKHTTITPPKDVATIAVPASPARRAEMAGIGLRAMPMRAPAPKTFRALKRIVPAPPANRKTLTPAGGAAGSHTSTCTVAPGQSVHTQISGSLVRSGTLTSDGVQAVRVILLGGGEEPLSDTLLAAGKQSMPMPLGLKSVFLTGEGNDSQPGANHGIEGHCALLALGHRVFAGQGCLLESHVAPQVACYALDTVPASKILSPAMNATFHFHAPAAGSSLILKVAATVPNPGNAAANVRWRSVDATLGKVGIVAGAQGVAIMMPVDAKTPWTLDVDLGVEWRLTGVVVSPASAADMTALLTNQANWTLLDDRFYADPALAATSITLEIAQ